MPDGLNDCAFIGNLGRDPEMRYTANGVAQTSFSLAVSHSWMKDGQRQEQTEWVPIVVWGNLAEVVGQNLTKGRRVYVSGRFATRSWEKDGAKHYRTEIVADKVLFQDRKSKGDQPMGYPDAGDIDPDDLPFDLD